MTPIKSMTPGEFTEVELTAAVAREVTQCVIIGPPPALPAASHTLQLFAVDEEPSADGPGTFVPTCFQSEALATALEKSQFDRLKASLFVWLGGVGYRTVDAAISSLAYVGSLPKGSGVVFDYVVERTSLRSLTHGALDALASRIACASGGVKYLIQPQAVAAMLRGLGFSQIVDLALEEDGAHLVSAIV